MLFIQPSIQHLLGLNTVLDAEDAEWLIKEKSWLHRAEILVEK